MLWTGHNFLTSSTLCSPNEDLGRLNKALRISRRQLIPIFDKPAFSRFYAPQTTILESRVNIRERIFKALFTYVSTRFGLSSFEKCFENAFPNVCSVFQNLRLGSIDFPNYFNHESWFTILCSPNEDFEPSKNMWVMHFVSTFHHF